MYVCIIYIYICIYTFIYYITFKPVLWFLREQTGPKALDEDSAEWRRKEDGKDLCQSKEQQPVEAGDDTRSPNKKNCS